MWNLEELIMAIERQKIEQRIEQLETLARALDAQVEHTECAREQAREQIELLKESLAERPSGLTQNTRLT